MSAFSLKNVTPESIINIVCVAISAIAPALTLGTIGVPLGLVAAAALVAAMKAQQSPDESTRNTGTVMVWIVRGFVLCLEQMAYSLGFEWYESPDRSLPFGWSVATWSWLSVSFMAACDIVAYMLRARRSAAEAYAMETEASYARAAAQDKERHERIERAAQEQRAHEANLAKIAFESKREETRIQAEAQQRVAEAQAKAAKKVAEAESEARQKEAEERLKATEVQAEADKKKAEIQQKQQEEDRRVAEAKRQAEAQEKAHKQAQEREKQLAVQQQAAREKAALAAVEARQRRWQMADYQQRTTLLAEAEAEIRASGGNPTREAIGKIVGVTGRTVQQHYNQPGTPKPNGATDIQRATQNATQ